jgi:pimeloyl-ACP methyl ester carboxylesterase
LTRRLALSKTQYQVAAGGRVEIEAPQDSLVFMRRAEHRTARTTMQSSRSFALAREDQKDALLLGVPFTTPPGDYVVAIRFVDDVAEERAATISLRVEPFVLPQASPSPPVVLLDGFQVSATSSCPMSKDSSGTFGNLQSYLSGPPNSLPPDNIYFFENCTECPNCSIEQLGAKLAAFLNSLPVAQVDVVAHSMGGLIIRSYLAGKQFSGGFSPPLLPKIRKAVFIATPHFGSFRADGLLASILFGTGAQANAMKRGSAFLWDLATWNQFGDDLRGVEVPLRTSEPAPW